MDRGRDCGLSDWDQGGRGGGEADTVSGRSRVSQASGIRDADLCAVLGNLLDNALEAAEKVEAAEGRWVRLTMRGIHQMLVIRVENGFQEKPVEERGEWKSTKTEGGLHGWGLKSARIAAEKYEGTVSTVCEQNVFRATATLCFRLSREEISGD